MWRHRDMNDSATVVREDDRHKQQPMREPALAATH